MGINKVILSGFLTREPEIFHADNAERIVCKTGLAVHSYYQQAEHTIYLNLVAFRKIAQKMMTLNKGEEVTIVGRISQSSYVDRNNVKRVMTEYIVDELYSPVKKNSSKEPSSPQQYASANQQQDFQNPPQQAAVNQPPNSMNPPQSPIEAQLLNGFEDQGLPWEQ